jgi:Tfp pilus assembly protein PilF
MNRSSAAGALLIALMLALALTLTLTRVAVIAQDAAAVYRPKLAVPESLAQYFKNIEPGSDAFPLERTAMDLEARLRELGAAWRAAATGSPRAGGAGASADSGVGGSGGAAGAGSARAGSAGAVARLLTSDFRGGRLLTDDETKPSADAAFDVRRAPASAAQAAPTLDARAFGAELQRFVADLKQVTVAEFQITSIDGNDREVRTDVRFDIVGSGTTAWRIERTGTWRMRWRRAASGSGSSWQIAEWTDVTHVTSRARTPMFSEITQPALGGNESFRRQLQTDLDAWSSSLDSVVTFDSNGHHGVSVGDADGDGLEDLYISQPAGLPNRLFRARGDGTFEDATERAGLGVLDDTTMSLFADVDNDGDEDLILATRSGLILFENDGTGRFKPILDAFQVKRPLQGALTSMAMADYDRDGYLDLYLCIYTYSFGAGEDKAGTPMPYHDARNGPPGALFRNDGHGRFVEVTEEAGFTSANNERYHFAAAWGDYDGDGWPDLLVANDFGVKSLFHNLGRQGSGSGNGSGSGKPGGNGRVTFEEVAEKAGVLDHGAGMSASFVDYDNDGRLDIFTGNMWTESGQRITAMPTFLPDAPADVRALYRHHTRGNGLFRNRGDGTFEDKTIDARAAMGRWSWSSDAIDFDNDGWEDLYVANGMITREDDPDVKVDLESFFWRQVVARSPLTRVKGTPYDDAWRAMNILLMKSSIAGHQRNVMLRNDGHGGFDEVSGAVGLDLEQDGRSFAVLDIDRDGRPDLAVMAARQAPQLRLFRNDFAASGASVAIRLTGKESNRDAVGARVTIETDVLRRTKIVTAGSGFLSQHSKELLFGLGASQQIRKVSVDWPSGKKQEFADVPLNRRLRLVEGGTIEQEPFAAHNTSPSSVPPKSAAPPDSTWLYEPFAAPELVPQALRGKPAVLLFWSGEAAASKAAADTFTRGSGALTQAGLGALAIRLDDPTNHDVGLGYAILHRHVFMNRRDMRLPTLVLLDAAGRVVKFYRSRVDIPQIVKDAAAIDVPAAERLSRAVPFRGTFYAPLPGRNYLPYGRELLDQGLESAAVTALEHAAQATPDASTLYRLGALLAKSGETTRARAAFERALALQPDLAEANNDLGALLAQAGDIDGAIARFRAALTATPEYPDALNNLGYALLLTGHDAEARAHYEKALALQPDFPEALNNLGMLSGRAGDLDRAERYFRDALARREDYGEAANNLALVLVARGQRNAAVQLLEQFLAKTPQFENAYVILAKIHFTGNETAKGVAVLERLLQRNPTHPVARELLRQWKSP